MFIFQDEVTAWWPVKVKVPDDKKIGRFITHEFEALFRVLDADDEQSRIDARADLLKGGDGEDEVPTEDIVKRIYEFDFETWTTMVIDWKGVQDADRQEVPFSQATLIKAVKQPIVRAAFARAYTEILAGEARKGN